MIRSCAYPAFVVVLFISPGAAGAEDPAAKTPPAPTVQNTQPPVEEVEPLDAWAPIAAGSTTDSTIKTSNNAESTNPPKGSPHQSGDDVQEEMIEIKAMVTDAGLKKVDPEALLKQELTPRATELTKREQKRFETLKKIRLEIAKEQAKKLGIPPKNNLDPRGNPEITVCSINANNYGTKDIWKSTFRRSDIPKRTVMRRTIIKAIREAGCDLIAVQNILGKDDADALQSSQEILGYKTEERAGWKTILGAVNREVSRNAILYRDKLKLVATEKFTGSRLTSFGSFRLDQLGVPPLRAVFEVRRAGSDETRNVSVTSFTLKNSVNFSSDETEVRRIQLAEFIRTQTASIKRAESEAETIVILAGNRAGSADSVGTQILEGRYKLADFLSDGACSFNADGTISCLREKMRPKELFGVVGSSSPESFKAVMQGIKIKPPGLSKKGKSAAPDLMTKIGLLASEIYMDGADYYLGLSKAGAPGKFDLRVIPVRTGLPESPFLALRLNW